MWRARELSRILDEDSALIGSLVEKWQKCSARLRRRQGVGERWRRIHWWQRRWHSQGLWCHLGDHLVHLELLGVVHRICVHVNLHIAVKIRIDESADPVLDSRHASCGVDGADIGIEKQRCFLLCVRDSSSEDQDERTFGSVSLATKSGPHLNLSRIL